MSKIKQLMDETLLGESFEKEVDYETLQLIDKAKNSTETFYGEYISFAQEDSQ